MAGGKITTSADQLTREDIDRIPNRNPGDVPTVQQGGELSLQPNFSDTRFTFSKGAASKTWTINHNLGKFPSVAVVDSGNNTIQGEIEYVNANTVKVHFNRAVGGKAYLN